ncbi:hypothetical protein F2P56_008609 [Juglans regia]|nr:hypothetical protein F2P56_008609 [Juglans regia]
MSELRHLQLFGNKLTNDGFKAILDGCHHLESLDLRQCFNVNLTGNLGRRCAERIKDLRSPCDSIDDYEFNAELHDTRSFMTTPLGSWTLIPDLLMVTMGMNSQAMMIAMPRILVILKISAENF